MGISHIALAVKDIAATHAFYTDVMGFKLVKAEVVEQNGGKARHLFYSTGSANDQLIAFWDLSMVPGYEDIRTDISRDLDLAPYTNHLAFAAHDRQDIEQRKQRWIDSGRDVVEIDHGWVYSIYTEDPDGIVVEFATLIKPFTAQDATSAEAVLSAGDPPLSAAKPAIKFHQGAT